MSADILRAAATKLRQAAEKAGRDGYPWYDRHDITVALGPFTDIGDSASVDATYIALVNPGFGLAVADLLEATASTEASYFDDSHALAVARSIVGDPS